ncbi:MULTISPECIES: sigma-70 family RNA polymerase sigma factor [unclassified Flavobacterium]|uniref:RNA polymerase sigma factor n=1 Tax=unclassified Flavobacterium TaxID=196869 RepID=UPI002636D6EC|nr:sigma-70 family RNA polymerase sigma factor [Flavobacterium sp.]
MSANLIIRLREDDESCFREIYDLYAFKVYCFVKKYTKQPADAEDVTQNVFIHLWNYRKKLNPEVALESVLFKSSKQEISKWYQKQNRIFTTEEKQIISEMDTTYESDEVLDSRFEQIEQLLRQIPEKRRKIFTLHKFEERSYKEIASEMNMTPGAVANQISKTLQYLKKHSVKNNELYWFLLMFVHHVYIDF